MPSFGRTRNVAGISKENEEDVGGSRENNARQTKGGMMYEQGNFDWQAHEGSGDAVHN
jgi:hypothetical protein